MTHRRKGPPPKPRIRPWRQWHNAPRFGFKALPGLPPLLPTAVETPYALPARSVRAALIDLVLLALCVGVAGALSVWMGQDVNWDLQNYHYYIGWAWWHDHRAYAQDIAAAQLQTYHNPLLDLPFYLMVEARWSPPAIAFALAAPAGIAAFLLIKTVPLLFGELPRQERRLASLCAVAIGLTSAMGVGVLGTTMNEWPGAALTMAAVYVLVRALVRAPGAAIPAAPLVASGVLAGLANGSKFTYGVFAVGLCLGILWRGPIKWGYILRAWKEAIVFGLGVLAGTALTAGAWMWALWTQFRNPIFPYGNIWIKSPWWGVYEAMGRPYGPHKFLEWVVFPFTLVSPPPFYVSEVQYTDPRLTLLCALAVIAGFAALAPRLMPPWRGRAAPAARRGEVWRVLGLFFVITFLLWTAQSSILRYLVPLFMLSGALIVALLRHVARPAIAPSAMVLVTIVLIASTRVQDWGRADFGPAWFDVKMSAPDKNALVLLTSQEPMSYVLPFFPPDARFLGINNSISDAKRKTLMEEAIVRSIREHRGPIYSLSYPRHGGIDALLARGLLQVTETCVEIVTNLRTSPIEMCRVVRASDGRAP